MTADVINLRTARKQKARAMRAAKAAENRVLHGQSKADKTQRKALAELDERRLDQAKLTPGDNDRT